VTTTPDAGLDPEARRLVGQRVPRVNDRKLLTGTARYLDDLEPPGTLHAAIVRSPVPHAEIRGIDTTEARAVPGVVAVLGPAELPAFGGLPILWKVGDGPQEPTAVLPSRARSVGQPLAVVVATSRYVAEDAADVVQLDLEPLPGVGGIAEALAPDAPLLYPELGSNVLTRFESGDPADVVDAVFAAAERTSSLRLKAGRVHGAPMECRGVIAAPDVGTGQLTVWCSTQAAHATRDGICEALHLPLHQVRVITPDVGGGFGLKDHAYEDEILVVAAAVHLGRPVKWVEDRYESLVGTTHARDEEYEIDVAYDLDGRLRGLRIDAVRNNGSHLSVYGGGPLFVMAALVPGPYRWDAVRTVGRVVATNRGPVGAYRGFGQTQAAFVRERVVDHVAADLGLDPIDVRIANAVGPDELPYTLKTFITFENGDYHRALRRVRELTAAWPEPPDDGRARGVGYAFYVQMAGIGPSPANQIVGLEIGAFETCTARVEPDGTLRIYTGISPHGQGQETTFAQLAADRLGIPIDHVQLVSGDTDSAPYSAYGTAASRSIVVGGGAMLLALDQVAAKMARIAAEVLEANPDDIVLADGACTVAGTNVSVSFRDVASRAWKGFGLPAGDVPGLVETASYDPVSCTFSYAAHACRVAVDRSTGVAEVERYAVVNDCGTVVNPTIVEGQIHGGVAQGLGAALLEEVVFADDGTPRSTTLLDYLWPVQASIPDIEIEHLEIPSPYTPGGMKGMGEGGTNGAFACVVNGVAAALPEVASRIRETPLTPPRIWALLHEA
jgi:aerobic carbon-monoxide dehydrogenase large subunit